MTFIPHRLALSLSFALLLPLVPTCSAAAPAKSESPACKGDACQETAREAADLDLFVEALTEIRKKYVDEVDEEELIEAAIEGMVRSLDRHSRYFEPERLEAVREHLRGEYGGIGVRVTKKDGRIEVVTPWKGMPAFRAGIRRGDVITRLDGDPLGDIELSEAIERMRGPRGTQLAMTVHRDGLDAPLEFTLTRELISIRSVRYRAEGPIGYIRITRFDRQTQHGLEEAIEAIKAELGDRLLGYILDLRGNPGGLVNQAVSVSDSFLEEGRIITTRGRYPSKNREYDAAPGDLADGLPMVVLINGRSASASEIVAGALHDHHRALLLGTRSYGKGTVQSTISLENHGAIRITTARYYTPSGNSIHGSGIVPDVIVEEPQNETAATTDGDEKPAKADTQLTRAIDLLCGIATFRGLENLRTHRDPPHPTMTGAAPGEGAETGRACPAQRPFVTAILPGDV